MRTFYLVLCPTGFDLGAKSTNLSSYYNHNLLPNESKSRIHLLLEIFANRIMTLRERCLFNIAFAE